MKEPINKISKEDLYNDIKSVIEKTNNTTINNYIKYGKYSKSPIKTNGGWNKILTDLGYKINMHKGIITKEEVIEDYILLQKKYGKVTSIIQRKYGNYSQKVIDDLFGSFGELQKLMGEKVFTREISDEDILINLYDLYLKYGFLNQQIIQNECIASYPTVYSRIGSVGEICYKLNIPIDNALTNQSKFSKYIIKNISMYLNEKPILEKTFDWLINPENNCKLRIDAYFPEHSLAIECDGKQHRQFTPIFHKTEEEYIRRLQLDKIKDSLLKEHNILELRIPDNMPLSKVINILNVLFSK